MSEDKLSAQVILHSASGDAGEPATADTVAGLLPPEASVRLARSFFRSHGFEVSPAFATSFSITAPAATYEAIFGRSVELAPGGVTVKGTGGAPELPLDRLPAEVATAIQAVVFPPRPDFGPAHYQ